MRMWVWIAFVACSSSSSRSNDHEHTKETVVETKVGPLRVVEGPNGTVIETKAGPIGVVDHMPDNAQLMCSADYQVYPRAEIHVVPTFNADLQRYVGGYRCNTHWKAAIREARARFASQPTEDEGGGILQVFLDHGINEDQLRAVVGGKALRDAIPAALDALESGQLILQP
jgi:hypothetical protein